MMSPADMSEHRSTAFPSSLNYGKTSRSITSPICLAARRSPTISTPASDVAPRKLRKAAVHPGGSSGSINAILPDRVVVNAKNVPPTNLRPGSRKICQTPRLTDLIVNHVEVILVPGPYSRPNAIHALLPRQLAIMSQDVSCGAPIVKYSTATNARASSRLHRPRVSGNITQKCPATCTWECPAGSTPKSQPPKSVSQTPAKRAQ